MNLVWPQCISIKNQVYFYILAIDSRNQKIKDTMPCTIIKSKGTKTTKTILKE